MLSEFVAEERRKHMEQLFNGYNEFTLNFKVDKGIDLNREELDIFNTEFAGNKVMCKCNYTDNSMVLTYVIPATLPLEQFLNKQLYRGELLDILSNIVNQLIFLENNEMSRDKVMLNMRYMYIELSNLNVQLLYMPVEKKFAGRSVSEFLQLLINKVRYAEIKCVNCVEQIMDYIDDSDKLNLKEFYDFLQKLKNNIAVSEEEKEYEDGTTVLKTKPNDSIVPYLLRLSTNEMIPINKDSFRIGKSFESDFQILDNRRVSRRHCTIKLKEGKCYIRDNESTNHTYINGVQIEPNKFYPINSNDYIRMADEEFKFWMG